MTDPRLKQLRADLESRRQELLAAVEAVPRELRNRVGAEGTWSVAMLIEHLVQTEEGIARLIAGLLPQARARSADEPFDAGEFARHVDMPLLLDRSRRIRGRQPAGSMDAAEGLDGLGRSRAALYDVMERGSGLRLEDVARDHPAGMSLTLYQWLAFVGYHEVRHAAQIREIHDALTGRT